MILSDPQERAWYDNHRDAILQGKDGTEGEDHSQINLWTYFSTSCFDGYDKQTPNNFYKVYADLFEAIDNQEQDDTDDYISPRHYFGNGESSLDSVATFYGIWEAFSSKRTFGWAEKWRLSEAPDRRIKRLMEKENKKVREKARTAFNETVRALVAFVKKRDPRWNQYVEQEEQKRAEKDAVAKQRKAERMAKKREEMERIQEAYEEQMDALDLEELGIDMTPDQDDLDREELYCAVCKKPFRSKNQWLNHEKSKKHLEAVEKARSELLLDGEVYDPLSSTPTEDPNLGMDELGDDIDGLTDEQLDEMIAAEMAEVELNDLEEENSEDCSAGEEPEEEEEEPEAAPEPVDSQVTVEEEEEEEEEEVVVLTSYRSRKKQKKQKKKQKALNAFGKSRQAPPEPLDESESEDTPSSVPDPEPEPEPELEEKDPEPEEPKAPTKKKGRRAKNRQKGQQSQASGKPAESASVDTRHVCVTCKSTFPSRNKLFAHVKKTGHAKPL